MKLYAHSEPRDFSISISFFDGQHNIVKRDLFLRNLCEGDENIQLEQARQILKATVKELRYLTKSGVDKGIIRENGNIIEEIAFHNDKELFPTFFLRGVKLILPRPYAHFWIKRDDERISKKRPYINESELSNAWQKDVLPAIKSKSITLPVFQMGNGRVNIQKNKDLYFFHVVKNSRKKENLLYDRNDPILTQFLTRFTASGNLGLNPERCFIQEELNTYAMLSVVKWPVPKPRKNTLPHKSRLASQPTDDTEFVYLIRMGRHKIYKIGKSNDPQGRLDSLQSANPHKLKLLHVFRADNASAAEESLHHVLHKQRTEGEWFRLSDVQRNAIISVAKFELNKFHVESQLLTVEELFQTA